MEEGLITHYSAVLSVREVAESIEFYCFSLGFDLLASYGTPPYYAEVRGGSAQSFMLLSQNMAGYTPGQVSLAFYSEDIDSLYQELLEREVKIKDPIGNKAYGMREFQIEDPNGYLIIFRQKMR